MGYLQNIYNAITGKPTQVSLIGSDYNNGRSSSQNLPGYIAPIQFYRQNIDLETWRSAVEEAERQILPYRVKMQRIFADLVLDAHVSACWDKRKNLTLLKEFALVNEKDEIDEKATELINTQWFKSLMNYSLDANGYGYSLVGLGPMYDYKFNEVRLIKRENVSPDRELLSPIVYSPQGEVYFNDPNQKDENGFPFYDWSIWVTTNSETGQSKCGYGLFYKIARYEIFLRHNLSDNATFNEMFAQPYRALFADLINEDERSKGEAQLKTMGSSGYGIFPKDSDLKFIDGGSAGNGYKSYDNFDTKLEKKISKLILGHEDALHSTPGKLGSDQGGEKSPVQIALNDIEVIDNNFFETLANDQIIPKLQNIGLPIKPGLKFRFINNKEKEEIKEKQNNNNAKIADIVLKLSQAGFKVTPEWIKENSTLEVIPAANENPLDPTIKEKLNNTYK